MDNQQVPMFKEWFIDTYLECKDYLDLTYFDVEKNTFIAKCSYNPDSGNAAKVLRIAFGSWQHQQAKVEEQAQEIANLKSLIQGHELRHQQNLSIKQKLTRRSEELEEEFAEDERFLKEQIKDKDLKISNLEYQQGMDRELIQSLQSKSEKLQKRVDAATRKWIAVTSIATTCPNQLPDEFFQKLDELHDALCGYELEQALKGEG